MSENKEEKEFAKGFNHGYLLRQYRSGIKLPGHVSGESLFAEGMLAGVEQYDQELQRSRIREKFKPDHSKDKGNSQNRGR